MNDGAQTSTADRLFGWTPFRAAWHGPTMLVDWCHLHARRMTEPFFYETIMTAMREPFNLVFQQRTPIEALAALPPGVPPAGFIFHMSRCGSTLVSQALAAFESNIVVSEAAPLRTALRAARSGRATPEAAATGFASLVNAYAQPRFSYEARLFVKFMAADVLDITLVRQAFPDVPWIFVTRDPAEILASQDASAGIDLLRGQLPPSLLGLGAADVWTMDPVLHQAHALAAFGQAALAAHGSDEGGSGQGGSGQGGSGKGLIVDHTELPDALWTKVAPHFGLSPDAGAVAMMGAVSQRHSKAPGTAFARESDPNRAGAAPFRSIAYAVTGPVMAALDALRRRA